MPCWSVGQHERASRNLGSGCMYWSWGSRGEKNEGLHNHQYPGINKRVIAPKVQLLCHMSAYMNRHARTAERVKHGAVVDCILLYSAVLYCRQKCDVHFTVLRVDHQVVIDALQNRRQYPFTWMDGRFKKVHTDSFRSLNVAPRAGYYRLRTATMGSEN